MSLPTDLVFWLLIPALFIVLLFSWLVYLGRGKRETVIRVSGLGIALTINSTEGKEKDD